MSASYAGRAAGLREHLAEQAGLTPVQLSRIENGASDPKMSSIIRLAKALKVSCGDLMRC